MGHGRNDLAAAARGQVGKQSSGDLAGNVRERVAIEEEKRGAAMALPQEFYSFGEGGDFGLSAVPLCFNRSIAL